MKAIIPVAGFGTRLRPHTHTLPKALMLVAGKPILAHIIDELVGAGVDTVVMVVGYLGDQIEAFARERYSHLRLHFVVQGDPLGNGHAVYMAREHLDGSPVVVIFGDTVIKGDLLGLVRGGASAAGVKEAEDVRRLGVVELDRDGFIRRFVEKPETPPSNLALVGVYYVHNSRALRTALEHLVDEDRRVRGEYWLADGMQLMVDRGERMRPFPIDHWYDCGTAEALLRANRDLLDLEPPARVATRDTAVIVPPSFVSPGATIERSVVGPHVSIADGARIVNSVIRDAIINAQARVQNALLEHSVIGERAEVTGRCVRVNIGDSSSLEMS